MTTHFLSFHDLKNSELYAILQLREMVFILEQTCLYADIDGKDEEAYHIFFKDRDIIVAYARYFKKGIVYPNHASIGRVLVHPKFRKNNLGHDLMRYILEKIEDLFEKSPIKISAQTYLEKFYMQYGFKK